MNNGYIWLSIVIMAVITYLIRVLPMTLLRKPVRNRFFRSFLYYVPYVTLAVMTFPAIMHATQSPLVGLLALAAGIIASLLGAGLFPVAIVCCLTVLASEYIMKI